MAKGKPGVMIYFETAKAIKGLDYETKGRLFEAIMDYAEDGVVPELDGVLAAVWPFVADKIERDNEKYERIREQRTNAINARWEKERAKATGEYESIQPYTDVYEDVRNIPTSTVTPSVTKTATATGALTKGGKPPSTPAPLIFGRYNNVFLTENELADLKAEFPGKWQEMIENLSSKIAMKGYKFENHLATLRSWEQEDTEKERQTARSKPLSQRLDMCDGITIDDYKNDIPLPL